MKIKLIFAWSFTFINFVAGLFLLLCEINPFNLLQFIVCKIIGIICIFIAFEMFKMLDNNSIK